MHLTAVLGGAPAWVYVLLVGLIVLGVRRLRTREVPVVVAVIPPIAFLAWSIVGAIALSHRAGPGVAASAWFGGALLGVLSAMVLPEARGIRLTGGRVRQPGSWLPLILYMAVFVARFACGAWAALIPEQAAIATATGVAVGAAMTARLVTSVFRWTPERHSGAAA
ncbi:hypothetical protein [Sphingomonas sp.]|uniref:hypothetical protein n=1 Tax=Sphingomonas sp. TaxID=28214 RepID=UPI0035BBB7AD